MDRSQIDLFGSKVILPSDLKNKEVIYIEAFRDIYLILGFSNGEVATITPKKGPMRIAQIPRNSKCCYDISKVNEDSQSILFTARHHGTFLFIYTTNGSQYVNNSVDSNFQILIGEPRKVFKALFVNLLAEFGL